MEFLSIALILIFGSLQIQKKEKAVLLDSYYNNEHRIDSSGKDESWHYKWGEKDNNGYSLLGSVFNKQGFKTQTSYDKPTLSSLNKADIYVIVDPDIPSENPNPNYIENDETEIIYNWVKGGGVLILLGNDPGNAEFEHLNTLAGRFSIHFTQKSRNHVEGDNYETGGINIPKGNVILKNVTKIYMKDISTLSVQSPAKAVLTDQGDIIMAISKVGKGTVFAAGDPWLYNEYTDGKKLPKEFQNYKAAIDLVTWLKNQIQKE